MQSQGPTASWGESRGPSLAQAAGGPRRPSLEPCAPRQQAAGARPPLLRALLLPSRGSGTFGSLGFPAALMLAGRGWLSDPVGLAAASSVVSVNNK